MTSQGLSAIDWNAGGDYIVTLGKLLACTAATGQQEPPLLAILAAGVDIDTTAPDGRTLLHLAVQHSGNLLVMKQLLMAGADPTAVTPDGETAADLLIDRIKNTGFAEDHFDRQSLESAQATDHIESLVDQAIARSIDANIAQLKQKIAEHKQDRMESAKAEREIRELDALIAGSAAGGYDNQRQRSIELSRMHERFERDATERQDWAQQTDTAVWGQFILQARQIHRKATVIYGADNEQREPVMARVRSLFDSLQ